jgi:hypothetical protein
VNRFICKDCGCDTKEIHEYYMVTKEIWNLVNKENKAYMLCIGCLENRLGRKLDSNDFIDAPINWISESNKLSLRLIDRIKN